MFLALTVAAAPLALGGCAQTATYGTGEVPEVALFHEMTGGLLSHTDKQPIDYQPRAPLVLPPSGGQLPPPVETASVTDGDWPADPDKGAAVASIEGKDKEGNPINAATPEQYRRLRPLIGVLPDNSAPPTPNSENQYNRDQMYQFMHQGQSQKKQYSKALAEQNGYSNTERRYLTDPPLGLEQPAGTAPTEFKGIGAKKSFWQRFFPG